MLLVRAGHAEMVSGASVRVRDIICDRGAVIGRRRPLPVMAQHIEARSDIATKTCT